MKTSDFFFDLPKELIAQTPIEPRNASRLLVLDRATGGIRHRMFAELAQFLCPGDLLVLNDSRVLPARLHGTCADIGGRMEFLLLEQKGADLWEVLVRPGKRARPGARFVFGGGRLCAEVQSLLPSGSRLVRFEAEGEFFQVLSEAGEMPLPPYITHKLRDPERYQTVYSRDPGSAAAPTAGLHFTGNMLDALRQTGVETAFVTLHVGLGTFRPVRVQNIDQHKMHAEHFLLPQETADAVNRARQRGSRVIAVGTTSCRVLEAVGEKGLPLQAFSGSTDIFLYPGRPFRVVDGLLTNFHLPESTLIMLVSAFAGLEPVLSAYREAVEQRYRFFSFGDAMLII
jgi:S-adenosylmethionine:tRNA ribosyltransferase-isomerase